jgi:protease-4
MAERRFKWAKWVVIPVVIILFFGGLVAAVVRGFVGVGGGGGVGEGVIEKGTSQDKIAVIQISGDIVSAVDPNVGGASSAAIIEQLDQAADDSDIKGVILDLNTPGGSVVGSDEIYRRVQEFRKKGKPVVALMEEVAASGGYYIAAAADKIIANPATITGSIGVIAILPNVTQAEDKIGVHAVILKSGPFKDAGSPFRDMTPDEHAIFQKMIDEAYHQFVAAVADGRHMDESKVTQLADGRIYTGNQAAALGLIDLLGDRTTAFTEAKNLATAPNASIVRYEHRTGLLKSLLGIGSKISSAQLLKENLGIDLNPGLKYIWLP